MQDFRVNDEVFEIQRNNLCVYRCKIIKIKGEKAILNYPGWKLNKTWKSLKHLLKRPVSFTDELLESIAAAKVGSKKSWPISLEKLLLLMKTNPIDDIQETSMTTPKVNNNALDPVNSLIGGCIVSNDTLPTEENFPTKLSEQPIWVPLKQSGPKLQLPNIDKFVDSRTLESKRKNSISQGFEDANVSTKSAKVGNLTVIESSSS